MKKFALLCSLFLLVFFAYKISRTVFVLSMVNKGEICQDVILDNKIIKKASGNRGACESRYKLIKQVLDKYTRTIGVLNIGANLGYYSFRIANDYDAICVMIESNNPSHPYVGDQLFNLCKANHLDNIIYLNNVVRIDDLKRLSECESFDVILALDIIHRFGSQWKEAADAILSLGDHVIIETPPEDHRLSSEENENRRAIEEYLLSRGAKILGEAPHRTSPDFAKLYFIEGEKMCLGRKTWISPAQKMSDYKIQSNYQTRTLTKIIPECDMHLTVSWVVGMNLLTFKMCNGVYPEKKDLKKAIQKLSKELHNDWMINNMILSGKRIALIDKDDPRHRTKNKKCSKRRLREHLSLMDLESPEMIEAFFWETIMDKKKPESTS